MDSFKSAFQDNSSLDAVKAAEEEERKRRTTDKEAESTEHALARSLLQSTGLESDASVLHETSAAEVAQLEEQERARRIESAEADKEIAAKLNEAVDKKMKVLTEAAPEVAPEPAPVSASAPTPTPAPAAPSEQLLSGPSISLLLRSGKEEGKSFKIGPREQIGRSAKGSGNTIVVPTDT